MLQTWVVWLVWCWKATGNFERRGLRGKKSQTNVVSCFWKFYTFLSQTAFWYCCRIIFVIFSLRIYSNNLKDASVWCRKLWISCWCNRFVSKLSCWNVRDSQLLEKVFNKLRRKLFETTYDLLSTTCGWHSQITGDKYICAVNFHSWIHNHAWSKYM